MAKTDIAQSPQKTLARSPDVFSAMREEMDRLFERFEQGWPRWPSLLSRNGQFTVPEIDVRETNEAITVEAELPGVDEKDVSVTFNNGILTIRGEKKQEREESKEGYYHLSERSFGSFERSIRLPDTIDDQKIEAKFDKGVLTVTAAKRLEAAKSARKIEIKKS